MGKVINFPLIKWPEPQQPELQPEHPMQKEIYARFMYQFLGEIGYLLEFEKWLQTKHYFDDYYLPYWETYQKHKIYGNSQEGYEKFLHEQLRQDEYEDAHSNYFDD
ncbi:hypothetical protein [Desulforamulus aeronauticus]|uniref:Uncharacterized protein n=1 Tax=Desulforamulus aeronauticus DSM 10349 TaxID=1121421 RepID=A0A1M6SAJ2_9FIRM|nr:hypothetical protein [Desulforamulus aeronauticus]SHK41793.1 hypothetical protein SAMN02745123_01772 [Desulforamulus aeronauticus DSM 10349]